MKIFTKRLWQFAGCASIITVAMYFVMYNFLFDSSIWARGIVSVLYFCIMFSLGWHFGRKDDVEYNIYDIGIRWHVVTFIICNGFGYLFWYVICCNSHEEISDAVLRNINTCVVIWGMCLVFHLILFLFSRRNSLKGYSKDELFE